MILAIDPGTTASAWVMFDGARVLAHAKETNSALLLRLHRELAWMSDRRIVLAVEMIASYGMSVGAEVFQTCVWIGRFAEAWAERSRPWRLVYRREVKQELCGRPQAKDPNVRQALLDRIGPQGTKKAPGPTYGIHGDEWAALGVAVVAALPARPERAEAAC